MLASRSICKISRFLLLFSMLFSPKLFPSFIDEKRHCVITIFDFNEYKANNGKTFIAEKAFDKGEDVFYYLYELSFLPERFQIIDRDISAAMTTAVQNEGALCIVQDNNTRSGVGLCLMQVYNKDLQESTIEQSEQRLNTLVRSECWGGSLEEGLPTESLNDFYCDSGKNPDIKKYDHIDPNTFQSENNPEQSPNDHGSGVEGLVTLKDFERALLLTGSVSLNTDFRSVQATLPRSSHGWKMPFRKELGENTIPQTVVYAYMMRGRRTPATTTVTENPTLRLHRPPSSGNGQPSVSGHNASNQQAPSHPGLKLRDPRKQKPQPTAPSQGAGYDVSSMSSSPQTVGDMTHRNLITQAKLFLSGNTQNTELHLKLIKNISQAIDEMERLDYQGSKKEYENLKRLHHALCDRDNEKVKKALKEVTRLLGSRESNEQGLISAEQTLSSIAGDIFFYYRDNIDKKFYDSIKKTLENRMKLLEGDNEFQDVQLLLQQYSANPDRIRTPDQKQIDILITMAEELFQQANSIVSEQDQNSIEKLKPIYDELSKILAVMQKGGAMLRLPGIVNRISSHISWLHSILTGQQHHQERTDEIRRLGLNGRVSDDWLVNVDEATYRLVLQMLQGISLADPELGAVGMSQTVRRKLPVTRNPNERFATSTSSFGGNMITFWDTETGAKIGSVSYSRAARIIKKAGGVSKVTLQHLIDDYIKHPLTENDLTKWLGYDLSHKEYRY